MHKFRKQITVSLATVAATLMSAGVTAGDGCGALPSHAALTAALQASVSASGGPDNGGFNLHMWATTVDRAGKVCEVTRTGDLGEQWPGSRVISAQKANTANAFSLPGLALSTANLYAAVQPGGSLFGLQFSNPVDTAVAYGGAGHSGGNASNYGTDNDPMGGVFIGGVNVFGGGLGLYDGDGNIVGALGVSGDSSCADHNIAWRVRAALGLDTTPNSDGIIYDLDLAPAMQSGFGHPTCGGTEAAIAVGIGAGTDP